MSPLPFLISIPHGGKKIPEELKFRTDLSREDILEDGDAFTSQIYDLTPYCRVIKTPIARAFIDLNRAPDMLPPDYPDGVVKSQTCYQKPVYIKDREPDNQMIALLIEKYYSPYYQRIEEMVSAGDVVFGFDCHTMAAVAPPISTLSGEKRPTINLGNAGGTACDAYPVQLLANCFRNVFGLSEREVTINTPFSGGEIVRFFGRNPIPWIQIEMNRNLYMTPPWFNSETWQIDQRRLQKLSALILEGLTRFTRVLR